MRRVSQRKKLESEDDENKKKEKIGKVASVIKQKAKARK